MDFKAAFKTVRHFLRTNFVTGLLIAVPFAVTIGLLAWVWQQIDPPLSSVFHFVAGTESKEGPWARLYHALINSQFRDAIVPLIGFLLIVMLVTGLGVLMRSVFGRMLLKKVEAAVGRLPLIGNLYGSVKQLGDAFISTDGKPKFQRAVAVQFPYPGAWAIGFVTGPGENVMRYVPRGKQTGRFEKTIAVFVPCSPLPTAGFTIVVPTAETMELDMSVQDALKLVVSGGMLPPAADPKVPPKTAKSSARMRAIPQPLPVPIANPDTDAAPKSVGEGA